MIRRYAALLALIVTFGTLMVVLPQPAQAQTSLRDTYRTQLDSYRTRERAYTIAREQYLQLQTLKALEDAVAATRQAMIERADVLITYFELQKAEVETQAGLSAEDRARLLNDLELMIDALSAHREGVVEAQDRAELEFWNVSFTQALPAVESSAYEIQLSLKIARLRAVLDRTLFLRDEVQTYTATASSDLKLAQRERAFDEIAISVANTETLLAEVKTEVNANDAFTKSTASGYSRDLGQVYAGISQLLGFVEEILDL